MLCRLQKEFPPLSSYVLSLKIGNTFFIILDEIISLNSEKKEMQKMNL